ncbi:hypothetical protein CBR_g41584 [Chara braunii]|uniref:HAT C-terminal dimerisation domain-containing protein n=1 Tax=Chara braunii TaxID=69332 RepID=A0A388LW78_CHABU|nr:hypothetical protein CBR_g41584 [Chara braunii]|eukprot:GBG86521.1 hypothetical protein CBR_g41584 [Chara braunii]
MGPHPLSPKVKSLSLRRVSEEWLRNGCWMKPMPLALKTLVLGLNLQDNQVPYIYSRLLPEPIREQLVAEAKSGKFNYRQFRDLALKREQMTAQVNMSYASVVKSGPVGGGKRVLWRRKREDDMLVVFDDDTVEKLPLDEYEGGGGNNDNKFGKGDVIVMMANKGGQSRWKKKRRPRSFPEHPGIAFGKPWEKMNITREEWQSKMDNRQCLKCPFRVGVPDVGADTQPEGSFEGHGGPKECGEVEGDAVVERAAASESGSRVLHTAKGCLVDRAKEGGGDDGVVVNPTAEDGQGRDRTVKPCGIRPTHGEDAGGGCAHTGATSSVLEKVRDRMKMMRQPVHALALLLDPRRRDPKWLLNQDNALVQRYLQRQIGGPWKSKAHVGILSDLREFHNQPTAHDPKRKDMKMWDEDGVTDADCISPSKWWATHGGDVLKLQAIAIKVMGMWSTATSTERNWSSMDLVHSKRRNPLKLATVEKLVHIHWNINLLGASKNLKDHHYVDLWAEFFESLPDAEEGDDPLWRSPRRRRGKRRRNRRGEAEDSPDDDFELGARPSIPGTTYVGRRPTTRRRRQRPPTTPSQGAANTSAQYNIQSDVELPQTDTDIDMVLRQGSIDADEAEADRAKAMADADREQVLRRMREEEERRAAIPTRREMEKQKKVGEYEPEPVWEMGQQEAEEEEEMGQQDEKEEHEMAYQAQEEEEMEDDEEEACMERREEEMEEDEGKGKDQQEEGLDDQHAERLGESEEQQHDEMANSEDEPQQQQHAPKTMYKRRKQTTQPAGSPKNSPEFPGNVEGSQHNNLWVSKVGRKRKAPLVDDVLRPKLPRGRPRKNPTVPPATKPKKKKTDVQASQKDCRG